MKHAQLPYLIEKEEEKKREERKAYLFSPSFPLSLGLSEGLT